MQINQEKFNDSKDDKNIKDKLKYREEVLLNLIKKEKTQDAIEKLDRYMLEDPHHIPFNILNVALSNDRLRKESLILLKKNVELHKGEITISQEIKELFHQKINQYVDEEIKVKTSEINMVLETINSISDKLDNSNHMRYPTIKRYTNNFGNDIFGIRHENLVNCILKYIMITKKINIDLANRIIDEINTTFSIEKLANLYKKMFQVYKNFYYDTDTNVSIEEIILELYSEFLKEDKEVIKNRLETSSDFYKNKWKELVPNEDYIEKEQIEKFYNSLPFPIGAFSPLNLTNLSLAYYALPIIFVNSYLNIQNVFDYGGNTGDTLVAIKENCNVELCMLVEENQNFIDYAKFRDSKVGRQGMVYKKESEVLLNIEEYTDLFDFGICTEVLEHVFDVEKTVETLSKLLKKGGVLYVTASFGLYPEASHLKKNVKYAGKEDELMAKYNLQRINISDSPIPLLSNMCFYQKI